MDVPESKSNCITDTLHRLSFAKHSQYDYTISLPLWEVLEEYGFYVLDGSSDL
jgi:hypothetical protein